MFDHLDQSCWLPWVVMHRRCLKTLELGRLMRKVESRKRRDQYHTPEISHACFPPSSNYLTPFFLAEFPGKM